MQLTLSRRANQTSARFANFNSACSKVVYLVLQRHNLPSVTSAPKLVHRALPQRDTWLSRFLHKLLQRKDRWAQMCERDRKCLCVNHGFRAPIGQRKFPLHYWFDSVVAGHLRCGECRLRGGKFNPLKWSVFVRPSSITVDRMASKFRIRTHN
jgi:hypothetical protein